jgi:hypothetical protein
MAKYSGGMPFRDKVPSGDRFPDSSGFEKIVMSLADNLVRDKATGRLLALFPNWLRHMGFQELDGCWTGFCPLFLLKRTALNRVVFNGTVLDRGCVGQTSHWTISVKPSNTTNFKNRARTFYSCFLHSID